MNENPIVIDVPYRNYTNEAKALKYVYLRSEYEKDNVVTIGYFWDQNNKTVSYQVARCSHGDRFCKKVGRDIVTGRYRKYGPLRVILDVAASEDVYTELESLWHPDMTTDFLLEE